MLMFWVTDNFLMFKKKPIKRPRKNSAEQSLLQRVKVQYRSMRNKEKRRDSESDILLSDDDELLEANPGSQRSGLVANT